MIAGSALNADAFLPTARTHATIARRSPATTLTGSNASTCHSSSHCRATEESTSQRRNSLNLYPSRNHPFQSKPQLTKNRRIPQERTASPLRPKRLQKTSPATLFSLSSLTIIFSDLFDLPNPPRTVPILFPDSVGRCPPETNNNSASLLLLARRSQNEAPSFPKPTHQPTTKFRP